MESSFPFSMIRIAKRLGFVNRIMMAPKCYMHSTFVLNFTIDIAKPLCYSVPVRRTEMNKLPASALKGGIRIVRERDIRKRGRPFNDMIECDPAICNCCGREIYKVAELVNGDIIGLECACIIPDCHAMRVGRFLNKKR